MFFTSVFFVAHSFGDNTTVNETLLILPVVNCEYGMFFFGEKGYRACFKTFLPQTDRQTDRQNEEGFFAWLFLSYPR